MNLIERLRDVEGHATTVCEVDAIRNEAADEIERLSYIETVAQEFCDRRECGEVHSTYTYNKFKQVLAAKDIEPLTTYRLGV